MSDQMSDIYQLAIGARNEPPPDPNAVLIDKQILGQRPFNKVFFKYSFIGSSLFFLVVLSEIVPILKLIVGSLYVIVVLFLFSQEVIGVYQMKGHIRKEDLVTVAILYGIIFVVGIVLMILMAYI